MHDKTIWSELWARAATRETIGLYLRFSDAVNARYQLYRSRPPGCQDYTICFVSDPNVLLILRPGIDPKAEYNAAAHAMIAADLNDTTEPLD